MPLRLTLTPTQAFALRDALASAARQPDSYDLALDPLWEAACEYCEQHTLQRLQSHHHSTAFQP